MLNKQVKKTSKTEFRDRDAQIEMLYRVSIRGYEKCREVGRTGAELLLINREKKKKKKENESKSRLFEIRESLSGRIDSNARERDSVSGLRVSMYKL